MTTGERIKASRLKAGKTQKEVADAYAASYGQSTLQSRIADFEGDRYADIRLGTLEALASAIGCNVSELIGDEEATE